MEVDHLTSDTDVVMSNILKELGKNTFCGIVVSSEIDNYKLENLPGFFRQLREIVEEKPIILLHPSRVHADDRELIKKSVKEPFTALQGHDLEFDRAEYLGQVLDPILL